MATSLNKAMIMAFLKYILAAKLKVCLCEVDNIISEKFCAVNKIDSKFKEHYRFCNLKRQADEEVPQNAHIYCDIFALMKYDIIKIPQTLRDVLKF